jgi:hypothetical protein
MLGMAGTGGNSHGLLSVAGVDGGVAKLGAGRRLAGSGSRRGLELLSVAAVSGSGCGVLDGWGARALRVGLVAVGVVSSRDTGEDECVTHVD